MTNSDLPSGSGETAFRRAIPTDARESCWTVRDGTSLRRIDWPGGGASPRGSILFLPGRGDCYEKHLESFGHWHAAGWTLSSIDWRGQAGSGRFGLDTHVGHIKDFALWIDDLAQFWREFRAVKPGPHVLIGHSMGGHLALRALAERAVDPLAAVLIAPMLGLHGFGLPIRAQHWLASTMVRTGDPRRGAWRHSEKPLSAVDVRMKLLTHDRSRYEDETWWYEVRPELAMGPASWGWVERALASLRGLERPGVLEAVKTPVLLLGTSADKLVSYPAIRCAAARLPHGELLSFGREAAHEILREVDPVRDKALAAIDEFLSRSAPAENLTQ